MSLATRILEYADLKEREITVPEWGDCKLLLRQLDAKEFDDAMKILTSGTEQEKEEFAYILLISSVYDPETREPVFTREHIAALMKKNPKALGRIGKEIRELNWASQSEEEIRKN